jgi:hypothetical protein
MAVTIISMAEIMLAIIEADSNLPELAICFEIFKIRKENY